MWDNDEYVAYEPPPPKNYASEINKKVDGAKSMIQRSSIWKAALDVKKKAGEFSAKYPNAVRHAITVCESVIDFYRRRNYVTLVRGGFQIFETIQSSNLYNFYQFARAADGFRYLTVNKVNIAFLFKDTLERFPKEKITFKNNETCDCYHLELGDVYFYSASSTFYIYYNQNIIDKDALTKFLVDEKFKDLNSNFLYLQTKENEYDLSLSSWTPDVKASVKATEIKDLILQFNNVGINRSLFLYGPPGTGKTTLAFKLLSDLGYRTIVFSASNKLCTFDLIKNLIDLLKIDAIIIDDFDQFTHTNKTLDLLEMFNKKLKVLVGVANTLKEFNVAILRPGRFDEIILVDQLDDACIAGVLGSFTDKYMKRVQKWPIAFIHELVKKGQFLTEAELSDYADELDKRVKHQIGDHAAKNAKKDIKKKEDTRVEEVVEDIKAIRNARREPGNSKSEQTKIKKAKKAA